MAAINRVRPAGMADATVPKGEEVFDGSDAAGEVGGADADAFRVGNPYRIDNDHRKAGVRYFLNSVIVTIGAVVPLVLFQLHGLLCDRPGR